jgi:hypothetical protein
MRRRSRRDRTERFFDPFALHVRLEGSEIKTDPQK